MELLTLSLENFQGLKHEEIQLDGHSASIYGRNASGKTTIFNAITWLLFGKPSTWAKNWDPKTKGPNGDLHNLEHSATGTFRLDDGHLLVWQGSGPSPITGAQDLNKPDTAVGTLRRRALCTARSASRVALMRVSQERRATTLICRANYPAMNGLIGFLADECCADATCASSEAAAA